MSLARYLLNGGNTALESEYLGQVEEAAGHIRAFVSEDPEYDSWGDAAYESLVTDLYAVDKAYHVADVIGEVKVMTEGAVPEVLMEGMFKSGIAKIKEAFNKFWEKLKSWFNNVKRQLMIIFKTGKKFIDEFKDELRRKDAKGYKYEGYKYTLSAGNTACQTVFDKVTDTVKEYTGNMVTATTNDKGKATITKTGFDKDGAKNVLTADKLEKFDIDVNQSSSDYQESFIKGLGIVGSPNSIEELRTELTRAYRDGEDKKQSLEDFEDVSKDEMIEFISKFDKKIDEIKHNESKFDSTMNYIIKTLDKLEKSDYKTDDTDGSTSYAIVQKISSRISSLLSIGKVPMSVKQAIYKDANAQFERTLKGYLRFKPAKEGYDIDDDEEGCGEGKACESSILDEAMRFFI